MILRLALIFLIAYLALLFTGYGVLIGSEKNAAGLGLQCKYLTARNIVTAQFINGDNGFIGITDCPILKKLTTIVE
ncbi:yobH-like family protein [Yersinia ruckeri]|uniref:YobH family protein n=1 Tax=Yersinia ruckeri TaxID=29486 RepID=UPI0005AC9910|nr:YobH family protein [Yersinia ruckeri]AJI95800.1 yobH-like family protein [Yersinia ruckeri]MCW6568147.1 YobH family protein [Yersinia ruckeri]